MRACVCVTFLGRGHNEDVCEDKIVMLRLCEKISQTINRHGERAMRCKYIYIRAPSTRPEQILQKNTYH